MTISTIANNLLATSLPTQFSTGGSGICQNKIILHPNMNVARQGERPSLEKLKGRSIISLANIQRRLRRNQVCGLCNKQTKTWKAYKHQKSGICSPAVLTIWNIRVIMAIRGFQRNRTFLNMAYLCLGTPSQCPQSICILQGF